MTIIETKFRVNDTAFVLTDKVQEVVIIAINIRLERSGSNMVSGNPHKPNIIISSYDVKFESGRIMEIQPDELFATKEDLKNTL